MKRLHVTSLALALSLVPVVASARTLAFSCRDENYVCYRDDYGKTTCTWEPGVDAPVNVPLERLPPTTDNPATIWSGTYTETVQNAQVRLDILLYETPGSGAAYNNTLSITRGTITAETSGVNYLRSALRFKKDGLGYVCTLL